MSRPESSAPADGRERRVLANVSFAVEDGAVYGIVGPSGSGKTSLLRLLNGLESPVSGRVLLDGEDISTLEPTVLRRRVGMVFQVPALFRGSVGSNVEYALALQGVDAREREERGRSCLGLVGLPGSFWGRTALELSQGEQQRISIARALASGPEVLLMDEPTSALDPASSGIIVSLVRKLNEETGTTVVFVTHLLEQARGLCERALMLVDGRAIEEGAVEQILVAPRTDMGRAFVEGRLDPHARARREEGDYPEADGRRASGGGG